MPLGHFITWLALAVTALGVVVAAAPGLRAPLWVLAGLLGWAWSGISPASTPAGIRPVDRGKVHRGGRRSLHRYAGSLQAHGRARPPASSLGGALLGAAALGPLGVLLGTTAGGVMGWPQPATVFLPGRARRRAAITLVRRLVQAGASVAMAAWLVARVLAV